MRSITGVESAQRASGRGIVFARYQVRFMRRCARPPSAPRGIDRGGSRVNSRLGPVSELTPLQRQGRAAASAATPEPPLQPRLDRKSTSELQSLAYLVFRLLLVK